MGRRAIGPRPLPELPPPDEPSTPPDETSSSPTGESPSTWEVANGLRKKLTDRAGSSPLAESLEKQCGVGMVVSPEGPLQVLDLGNRQLAELAKAENAALLEARGIAVAPNKARLEKAIAALHAEIHAGPGAEQRKGDARDDVEEQLLGIDVMLSRSAVFLRDYGADAAAEALEKKAVRRHQRRATEKPPQAPSAPANA